MAVRAPIESKFKTTGGDPGSAGYQGTMGSKIGAATGGAAAAGGAIAGAKLGAIGGAPLIAAGAAIGGLIGLIGDFFAAGAGEKKPEPARKLPQFGGRAPTQVASGGQLSDPGAAAGPSAGPNVRLQAAKNLGRRFG